MDAAALILSVLFSFAAPAPETGTDPAPAAPDPDAPGGGDADPPGTDDTATGAEEPAGDAPETAPGDDADPPSAGDDAATTPPADEATPPADEATPPADGEDPPAVVDEPPPATDDPAPAVDPATPESADAGASTDASQADAASESAVEPTGTPDTKKRRMGLKRHRFVYSNITALRYNPLGFVNDFQMGYRLQLIDKNTTLFKDSHISLLGHMWFSPAFGRIGPILEIQPLAILKLNATYDGVGYFGTFNLAQSFESPHADYSDTAIANNGEALLNQATTGRLATLSALLQAKVGRIAVRDNAVFYYVDLNLRRDPVTGREDPVVFSQTIDMLMPNEGWTMTNDADFLYLFDFGLTLGARYTYTLPFYRDSDFLPGESTENPNGPTHRVGPAVLYQPPKWSAKAAERHNHSRKRWRKPTAILLMQWWVQHRFRTGVDSHPGIPYVVLGLRFEGDFAP
ncbi:MAG: hypothetical protein AAF721_06765 [Myxococcota bacterium]